VVRILELSRTRFSRLLGPSSKLNRDRRFLEELMAQGAQQADEFFTALRFEAVWRAGDGAALLRMLADDLEITSEPPFPQRGPLHGAQARTFVCDYLLQNVRVDLTRAQHTADRVAWTVIARYADTTGPGRVEAEVRNGRVARIRLGPLPD
jgi:NTE family protein